jgi:hypothetical protein
MRVDINLTDLCLLLGYLRSTMEDQEKPVEVRQLASEVYRSIVNVLNEE